jgi:hypothetical protein
MDLAAGARAAAEAASALRVQTSAAPGGPALDQEPISPSGSKRQRTVDDGVEGGTGWDEISAKVTKSLPHKVIDEIKKVHKKFADVVQALFGARRAVDHIAKDMASSNWCYS